MPIRNQRSTIKNPVCANCGIPIQWQPTVVDGEVYCCLGCADGGPCECDYDHLPMPDDRVSIVVRREQIVHLTKTSGWFYQSQSVQVTSNE